MNITWISVPAFGVKLALSTTFTGALLACFATGFDVAGFEAVPPKKEATREAFSFSSFDACSSLSFSSASRLAFSSSQLSSTLEFFRPTGFGWGLLNGKCLVFWETQ